MKLISFAVVSLLAITVSAYPQQSTSTQDVQSYQSTSTPTSQQSQSTSIPTSQPSQSTSTNDAQSSQSTATPTPQPPYQDKVQVEIDRLTKIYEKEDDDFYRLNNDIQLAHETIVGIKDKIIDIDVQLKVAGIKAERRSQLTEKLDRLSALLKKMRDEYKEYQQPYENAMKRRNDAKAELKLLKENQRLMKEYNSKYGVQAGPSLNSVYNLDILTKQNTDILEEIDELLEKYNRLETEDYIHLYDQNISISPNEELYSKILLLQSQNGIAERILGDYKPNRSIDTIGLFLVETGIGPLLTRSLVSRVRLLERSVTKKTPINAICSSPDNDVFTLNVQGQLVRSQRWFWSRRTKQLYRNKYWLTPQARPKTVKQRHSFVLMETLRTCGDSASLQKYVTRQFLDTSGFFKDPSFDQSRAHGTRYLMLARMDALWTARKAIQIGILVDTHPFSVDHCILCDQQLLSTSIAHLVVECEQVAGHRIQSGLVPAMQKSRLRLLGRALDPGVENVYTWLRGGVLNDEADLDQRWLDGDCGA
ncbi:hypothetical protein BASA81_012188 [Batrachochytrium salamandrivorans]|nr:hypothetical protein BASA81_012188 [Batrachochytrium salamandrivorans]